MILMQQAIPFYGPFIVETLTKDFFSWKRRKKQWTTSPLSSPVCKLRSGVRNVWYSGQSWLRALLACDFLLDIYGKSRPFPLLFVSTSTSTFAIYACYLAQTTKYTIKYSRAAYYRTGLMPSLVYLATYVLYNHVLKTCSREAKDVRFPQGRKGWGDQRAWPGGVQRRWDCNIMYLFLSR